MTTLCGGNLNYSRTARAQQADVDEMKSRADIVCTCEDIRGGGNRERVLVPGKHVKVIRSGRTLAALRRFGRAIGWRDFAWRDIDIPGVGDVRVVSAHFPPLRMRGPLYAAYARRLRRLLRQAEREGLTWMVHADFNWLIRNDPAGLTSQLGAKFYGARIDGWAVHPALVRHVADCQVVDPKRRDNHVYTFLTLAAHPHRKEKP